MLSGQGDRFLWLLMTLGSSFLGGRGDRFPWSLMILGTSFVNGQGDHFPWSLIARVDGKFELRQVLPIVLLLRTSIESLGSVLLALTAVLELFLLSLNNSAIFTSISHGDTSFLFTSVTFLWLSFTNTLFLPLKPTHKWSVLLGSNAFAVWSLTTTGWFNLMCFGLKFFLVRLFPSLAALDFARLYATTWNSFIIN